METKILMSVDMDEWYQCRWATGSEYAIWPDTQAFFREYYGTDEPIGEIIPLAEKILHFFDENSIVATFFFTGEVASYYPDLVKEIANYGHEIASHNYVHKDYNERNPEEFYRNLQKSKKTLQELSGQEVIGYRAPNSTVSDYMIQDLVEQGFKYDSSVTPTRPIMGKFGKFQNAPKNPYQVSKTDFSKPGDSGLWEFPWPTFPVGNLPSGSGITTRVFGYYYTVKALDDALRTGDTVYYFHPYEIGPCPEIDNPDLRVKFFLRNNGERFFTMLEKIIQRYSGRFTHGYPLSVKRVGETIDGRGV